MRTNEPPTSPDPDEPGGFESPQLGAFDPAEWDPRDNERDRDTGSSRAVADEFFTPLLVEEAEQAGRRADVRDSDDWTEAIAAIEHDGFSSGHRAQAGSAALARGGGHRPATGSSRRPRADRNGRALAFVLPGVVLLGAPLVGAITAGPGPKPGPSPAQREAVARSMVGPLQQHGAGQGPCEGRLPEQKENPIEKETK